MNAEQERNLLEDVRTTRETVLKIKTHCGPCLERLEAHTIVLDGPPENGERPGLRARMVLGEAAIEEIKTAQRGQVKWMRAQLAAIITAVIAIASKWFIRG